MALHENRYASATASARRGDFFIVSKGDEHSLAVQLAFWRVAGQDRLEVQVVVSTALVDKPSAAWLAGKLAAAVGALSEAPRIPLEDVCVWQRKYVIEW
ncbi:hypothetical protein VN97_g5007 [Penicillium thymicola]|uniref:Uncharacterized protein n=1 Tax=Penicillium thymicola TaxID=293382 RepID=A0AAI9TJI9_PENTH|nr:hypothetical protein VN97_g5007 [Penicillium thymicola]